MFGWFKELFTLIKMLFSKVEHKDELDMVIMKHFPFEGYAYLMWCGNIVSRKKNANIKAESLKHEWIHNEQAALRYKKWIGYYWKYIREWIKGNPLIAPASGAYMTIPFEMEAYANASKKTYKPTLESLEKYVIKKDRKKIYRANRKNWKEYLKSL